MSYVNNIGNINSNKNSDSARDLENVNVQMNEPAQSIGLNTNPNFGSSQMNVQQQ